MLLSLPIDALSSNVGSEQSQELTRERHDVRFAETARAQFSVNTLGKYRYRALVVFVDDSINH